MIVALLAAVSVNGGYAQTFTSLFSFDGSNGENPDAALVQGTDGNLYGATRWAGTESAYPFGGTIFEITPGGTLTTLYNFCGNGCAHGVNPAVLLLTPGGNFFGLTESGGTTNCNEEGGCGTAFTMGPSGKLTTLSSFCKTGDTNCGFVPNSLVQATDGNLYGTTLWGGANCPTVGCGTVFKLSLSGTLTTIHSFCSQLSPVGECLDGAYPYGLIEGADGNLYGTTEFGGASVEPYGFGGGTVFKIAPGGTWTLLHSFCTNDVEGRCTDGAYPEAGLIQATDGFLYGTTVGGNTSGTIFRMTPDGTFSTLYAFCHESGCADGFQPYAGLIQATDGNLYGVTSGGGTNGSGTVFQITPAGTLTTLYRFCSQPGCVDGANPLVALVQATNGDLYGTTEGGGNNKCNDLDSGTCGTIFSMSLGLGPFVKLVPAVGKAGSAVTILGTDLTGASSVTVDGLPAAFTIVSATEITATIPSGAAKGLVTVVTPGGTLSSNVPLQIL
jgi:uncharacterized repeat protein (TIGR03803 family)